MRVKTHEGKRETMVDGEDGGKERGEKEKE